MNAIQLDLFTGAILEDDPVTQVKPEHDAAGFDGWSPEMGSPCKSCYLREWCSDECARLGFKIDSKYEPRGTWAQWLAK